MAIAAYDDLQAAVARFLRRGDLTGDIPGFIALAEAQMNRRLRVRAMIQRATASVTEEYAAVPDRYLGVLSFSLDGSPPRALRFVTPDAMEEMAAGAGGVPAFFTVVGGAFRFYPAPSAPVIGRLTYWQGLEPLSASVPSNWALAAHPDAYLYGALVQSAPFLRADERLGVWAGLFTQALSDIEASDHTESVGAALTPAASPGAFGVA